MKPLPIEELASALEARLVWPSSAGDAAARRGFDVGPAVVIDSRRVSPGALFVALPGERVDGYEFAAAVAAAGAGAMLASRASDELPTLVVDDPQAALGRLSRLVVDTTDGLVVVGVTGSSGKTSTKDLLAQILESAGPTVAPVGSFNNEIGVPLTACQTGPDTQFLISEMGARGVGHIEYLCALTPPTIGVELNVGRAHLGEFGGQEATARAKAELVAALPASGVAVLNADDPRVVAMASRTNAALAWFSAEAEPQLVGRYRLWAADVRGDEHGRYTYTLHVRDAAGSDAAGSGATVRLRTSGAHQVSNSLAAAAAAIAAGLSPDDVVAALNAATPRSAWRMEITERPDGVTVINDAYNANPDSMQAALRTAAGMLSSGAQSSDPGAARAQDARPRRGVAVLGDMLELGSSASQAHEELGALVAELGFARLIAIGEFGPAVCRGASNTEYRVAASVARTTGELVTLLRDELVAGDVVLVKASRGLQLETVAAALLGGAGSDVGNGDGK